MTDLRALALAATPGPWRVDETRPDDVVIYTAEDERWVANVGNWSRQAAPDVHPEDSDYMRNAFEADAADAALIVAMRNGIEALLDERDALRAALEATLEALVWASGSPSFAPEGEAHQGWVTVAVPAIEQARAALAAGSGR